MFTLSSLPRLPLSLFLSPVCTAIIYLHQWDGTACWSRFFSCGKQKDRLCAAAIIFQGRCPLRSEGASNHLCVQRSGPSGVLSTFWGSLLPTAECCHTHWKSHSLVRVQSAFQPAYNTRHVRNVVRSILAQRDGQKSSYIDFSAFAVTLINITAAHTGSSIFSRDWECGEVKVIYVGCNGGFLLNGRCSRASFIHKLFMFQKTCTFNLPLTAALSSFKCVQTMMIDRTCST